MLMESAETAAHIFTLKSAAAGVWSRNVPILEMRIIENEQCDDKLIQLKISSRIRSYRRKRKFPMIFTELGHINGGGIIWKSTPTVKR